MRINAMAVLRREESGHTWLASHRLPLVGFVLPLVNGDLQAAEDVVQETMIRGWQQGDRLERDRAGSWLHVVARNLAVSTYHRRRRARPPEVPLDEGTVPACGDGIDGRLDALVIAAALGRLSAGQRAVIVELYYRQRSVAEVAALLEIPEGTVRSRCYYGLRALREELERQGVTGS
jgi:RNA polymerase sigma-70 factor (ECF subfamily)